MRVRALSLEPHSAPGPASAGNAARAGVQPAPLGELKAAAGGDKGFRRGLNAPREWWPPLRRGAGGAAQNAHHHQKCPPKPRISTTEFEPYTKSTAGIE